MSLTFNASTKKMLTLLALTPAQASVITGTSMRKENKRGDTVQHSLFDLLYIAFHGDVNNADQASFVKLFGNMSGPFQSFVEKGYVTISTTQATQSQESREEIRFDFSKILCFDSHYTFSSDLANKIRKTTIDPSNVNLVKKRTLQNLVNNDKKDVRKIMAEERKFLDKDGNLPSGKNVDDLFDAIWTHFWQKHQEEKKINALKAKKNNDSSSDEDDSQTLRPSVEPRPASTILPQSNEMPTLVPDGKWYPPGFPTYFIYVCKFTRVNGDYIHLFASDGKTLDGSKAMSRKEERKQNAENKDKKRKADLKAGKNRGQDKDFKVINDLEMRSILMDEVNSLAFQVQTETQVIAQGMEFAKFLYGSDVDALRGSDEMKKIKSNMKKLDELSENMKKKRKEMNDLENKMKKMKKSDEVVTLE